MDPTRKDNGHAPRALPKVQLTIALDQATGGLNVIGPIENKVLALGMIEIAKSVVLAYKPGSGIQLAPSLAKPFSV